MSKLPVKRTDTLPDTGFIDFFQEVDKLFNKLWNSSNWGLSKLSVKEEDNEVTVGGFDDFDKGEITAEYDGDYLTVRGCKKKGKHYKKSSYVSYYLPNKKGDIDASFKNGVIKFTF